MVIFLVFGFHQRQVLFQNDPHVGLWLQFVDNNEVHVNQLAILVAHSLCKAWVTTSTVQVLISVQRHIGEPSDPLRARPAKNRKCLVADMHVYLQRHF